MSTTVELLAANERYERLRAAVEELASEVIVGGTPYEVGSFADGVRCGSIETARRFRALSKATA